MAEEIISLGCDDDYEVAYDEEILQYLREDWGAFEEAYDESIAEILNTENEGLSELLEPAWRKILNTKIYVNNPRCALPPLNTKRKSTALFV